MRLKKKPIVPEENDDPDTLQIKDELNERWVTAWKSELEDTRETNITFHLRNSEPCKNSQKISPSSNK